MNFKHGSITNEEGTTKPIIVNSAILKPKEFIIGGSLIMIGITYIMQKAFQNGVQGLEDAEYRTMVELDIIHKR